MVDSLPPGSLGLPFIGETLAYVRNSHRFFESRADKYGSVFKTRILGSRVVCFVGPDAFSAFADCHELARHGANPGHVRKLLCEQSLPLVDDAVHEHMRQTVLRAFEASALDAYIRTAETTTRTFLKRWEDIGEFAWVTEFKGLSASLCRALLVGETPGSDASDLVLVLDDFLAGLTALPIPLPWTKYGRALKSRERLLGYIDSAITSHEEESRPDMLTVLLDAWRQDPKLTREQLRAQMVHMFFAAYGGIYRTLTLLCKDLAQHPDVWKRARREVLEHCADGPLDRERLTRLVFVGEITQEVRRHNRIFASVFFSWLTAPLEYRTFLVPQGWKATGAIYATMQDTNVFREPERFDPDRFGPERAEDRGAKNAYIPQGGGSMDGHRCPGEDLTTILMKTVAVLLIREYSWELLPQRLELNSEPSPLPRDGLRVRFSRTPEIAPAAKNAGEPER